MNRYLLKGTLILVIGILLNLLGFQMKEAELTPYGWAMVVGTILFGFGFMNIFYSFIRKVEYRSIREDRADEAEQKARREAEVQQLQREKIRKAS